MSKKNRVVSFRLSDADYRELLDVCRASGVNSVSAFARFALRGYHSDGRSHDMDKEISSLQEQVDELQHALDRILQLARLIEK